VEVLGIFLLRRTLPESRGTTGWPACFREKVIFGGKMSWNGFYKTERSFRRHQSGLKILFSQEMSRPSSNNRQYGRIWKKNLFFLGK